MASVRKIGLFPKCVPTQNPDPSSTTYSAFWAEADAAVGFFWRVKTFTLQVTATFDFRDPLGSSAEDRVTETVTGAVTLVRCYYPENSNFPLQATSETQLVCGVPSNLFNFGPEGTQPITNQLRSPLWRYTTNTTQFFSGADRIENGLLLPDGFLWSPEWRSGNTIYFANPVSIRISRGYASVTVYLGLPSESFSSPLPSVSFTHSMPSFDFGHGSINTRQTVEVENQNLDPESIFTPDTATFNSFTWSATEYWPYDPGDGFGPIYDSATGAQLRPFPA
jgi:hypothetical protein